MPFPIGGSLERTRSLINPAVLRYYAVNNYWGHEFDLSRSRDVIGHVTI